MGGQADTCYIITKIYFNLLNMAAVAKNIKDTDTEVHITYDDQQQINTFARTNARLGDFKDELEEKRKEMQNLEDAEADIMMLEDSDAVPYKIGEVFVMSTPDEVAALIDKAKQRINTRVAELEAKCEKNKQILCDLKVSLYAKFGNNINLEADEE